MTKNIKRLTIIASGWIFLASFMTPIIASVGNWKSRGPLGGEINCIVAAPDNPLVLYAGTEGKGIYKTIDGCLNWSEANSGLTSYHIETLAIDPSNSSVIYAGTLGGVFKTIDGGTNWNSIGNEDLWVMAAAIDPTMPSTIYIGTAGYGIFKSTDGGVNWISARTGLEDLFIRVLKVDPSDPSIIYAGTQESGLYKSINNGGIWTAVNNGITYFDILDIAVSPSDSSILYVGTNGGGFFKSVDGGVHWTASNEGLPNLYVWSLAIDPLAPSNLLAGIGGEGIFRTVDGGTSWSAAGDGVTNGGINCLVFIGSSSPIAYAGTNCGIFKTVNIEEKWTCVGFPVLSVISIAFDRSDPMILYAATQQDGIFKSFDGGSVWTPANSGLTSTWVNSLVISPSKPSVLYAGCSGWYGYVSKTTDGGSSWDLIFQDETTISSLAVDPSDASHLFVGGEHIDETEDGGGHWDRIYHDEVDILMLDSKDPLTLYAGKGMWGRGIVKTTDGGASWTDAGFHDAAITALEMDPLNPKTIYAGVNGKEDKGLYKTTDGGASWVAVTEGMPCLNPNSVEIDPSNTQVLFAEEGTCGIFMTADGGATWSPLESQPPEISIIELFVDPTGSTLYAATDGNSIWSLELKDKSPVITNMKKMVNPFRITASGSNLQNGVRVFINDSEWTNVSWKSTGKIVLKGGKSLKSAVPSGTPATFRFVNPDGKETTMVWQW